MAKHKKKKSRRHQKGAQQRVVLPTQKTVLPEADTVEVVEDRFIKKDLLQTLIVNVVFIAILVGLYYWNQGGQPMDQFIGQIINL